MGEAGPDHTKMGDRIDVGVRLFSWTMLAAITVFLVNNVLELSLDWPGISPVFFEEDPGTLSWVQTMAYGAGAVVALVYVLSSRDRSLRADGVLISDINAYLVRAAFWIVLLVGVGDMLVSFLRVEGWLPIFVGEDIDQVIESAELPRHVCSLPTDDSQCHYCGIFSLSWVYLAQPADCDR